MVMGFPNMEKLFIKGDFNRRIESLPSCYNDVHGSFGFDEGTKEEPHFWIFIGLLG